VYEANGITSNVAQPQRGSAVANGRFSKESFSYDPAAHTYRCPGGQFLDTRYRSVTRGHVSIQYSSPYPCAACAIRARCTGRRWRRINCWEYEAVPERMATRPTARPSVLDVRRETVD